MKNVLFIIFIIIFLNSSCLQNLRIGRDKIPEWIYAADDKYQAVGRSGETVYLEDGLADAINDAITKIAKYYPGDVYDKKVRINKSFIRESHDIGVNWIQDAYIDDFFQDKNGLVNNGAGIYVFIKIRKNGVNKGYGGKIAPIEKYDISKMDARIEKEVLKDLAGKINHENAMPEWINLRSKNYITGWSAPGVFFEDSVKYAVINGLENYNKSLGIRIYRLRVQVMKDNEKSGADQARLFYINITEALVRKTRLQEIWIDKKGIKGPKNSVFVKLRIE
jgi:hypothetical protein